MEGCPTFILGITFHAKQHANVCLQQNTVRYSTEFRSCTTKVSTCSHGTVASVMTLNDPLVYTAEAGLIEGKAWATMELSVPSAMEGQMVHFIRMTQSDEGAYANKVGLFIPDCTLVVGKGGKIRMPVFNSGTKARQVPAMMALGRYSTDVELRSCQPSDLQIEEIVESLSIEGVDEEQLKARRQDVKNFITLQRQGYFSKDRLGRSCVGEFDVQHPTVDSGEKAPPNIPSRTLNPEQMEAAKEEFKKMVENGVLVPSISPWGAPIVMVKKPGGRGWRMCLDYRAGNELAVKQHYPLPKVQDTFDKIGKAKFFASLDCLKAFWQIPNSKGTQPKTAINFPWGKWEMTSMPMGMQAASATFQRTMDVLLRDIEFAVGFIDDILVYSNTWEEHLLHVALVLDRVGGAGFTFNPAKCDIIGLLWPDIMRPTSGTLRCARRLSRITSTRGPSNSWESMYIFRRDQK